MENIKLFDRIETAINEACKNKTYNEEIENIRASISKEDKKFFELGIYIMYTKAKKVGNNLIDIADWDSSTITKVIEAMRELGITQITVSSTWSGTTEMLWDLNAIGCKIAGMVQVNGECKDWETGEYNKRPAFLLNI